MKATCDNVIIEVQSMKERKIGSLIIPPTAMDDYFTGVVVAVGPGPSGPMGSTPISTKPGDNVMFRKEYLTGNNFRANGVDYYVVREQFLIIVD